MQLRKLERSGSDHMKLLWDDGNETVISLTAIRNGCPCAECKGETVLLHHVGPRRVDEDAPGRYELKQAEPIGNYAIRLIWGDGHSVGIYTWDVLRQLGE